MPFHKWNYWILFSCCSDSKVESVSPIIVMMFLEAKSWHCLWMLRSPKASSACSASRFTVRRVAWYIFDEPYRKWPLLNSPGQKYFSLHQRDPKCWQEIIKKNRSGLGPVTIANMREWQDLFHSVPNANTLDVNIVFRKASKSTNHIPRLPYFTTRRIATRFRPMVLLLMGVLTTIPRRRPGREIPIMVLKLNSLQKS